MKKKFKFVHKTGKVFEDKRGYLLKILMLFSIIFFKKRNQQILSQKDEHFCYILKRNIIFLQK